MEVEKDLYEMIRTELWDKHSISALVFMLDTGREINFSFKELKGGAFRNEGKWLLTLENQDTQEFKTSWSLLNSGTIQGKKFFDVWSEIELEVLF